MIKRTFSKEFMQEEVLWGGTVPVLENEIIDTSRWSTIYNLVFQFEDKLYQCTYSRGATECQDEQPFEYEDGVECVLVEPVEKTITAYEPVKADKENEETSKV